MIISNSLGKHRQDNFVASSVLLRSDGFKKITKGGFTSSKVLQRPSLDTKAKLHSSTGFRRYTKEYKIRENGNMDSHIDNLDNSTPFSRLFTPSK